MTIRLGRATFLTIFSVTTTALLLSAACGDNNAEDGAGPGASSGAPGTPDTCAHPNPGCDCNQAGQIADCGKVELKIGTFVSCSMGKMTCDGSKWGACNGDTIVAKSFSGGGLHLASLGTSGPCTNDPCDPYCSQFADTPNGLDASGLSAGDSGLTIPSTGTGACICNEPSAPASLYSNILAANKGNPASCSGNDAGTSTDNCNHDYQCVGGTCQPYPTSGVNASCGTAPDYTLGLGCHDGTSWQLEVCNRGYVPSPGIGSLVVAIGSGSPSSAPGACVTGSTGAAWPTGPSISGVSPDTGKCVIDLAATSIGAGECVNVDLATQCTELDGVTPLNALSTAHHWAAINPSTAILPGNTPLPECDTCNNYTALEQNAIPPLLSSAAACAPTTCGTVCGGASDAGVDGGSGCHTYVSGTVYDPGGNIPLPGIAVYEPNAALTAFTPGVSCDTCASVLPPTANIVASTFSDLNGTFALEVNATTGIPVVFQTGRWRRQITIGTDTPALTACAVNNITVPADCYAPGTALLPNAYPAKNCKTRLPQTSAEGDIPLTAIVAGQREPFECSIAKFMGGWNEIGVGGGKRVQLYTDTGANVWDSSLNVHSGTAATVTVPATASGIGAGITQLGPVTLNYLHSTTRSNTGWKIGAPTGGFQTITSLSGLNSSYAPNGTITLSGSTVAADNGTWTIAQYVSSSSVKIAAITGGAADNTGGASRKWRAGFGGALTSAYVGGTITITGATNAGNNGTFTILSVPTSSSVTITDGGAVFPDAKSGQSGVTWLATAPGTLTIGGLNGMTAADVNNTITFSGATNGGNNGAFTIASVVSPTQITISNSSAVTDTTGTITWLETTVGSANTIPDVNASLWDTQAHLNAYDELILPCGGNASEVANIGSATNPAAQGFLYNFLKAGGRDFGNHWSARGIAMPTGSGGFGTTPWTTTSTFQTPSIQGSPGNTLTGRVAPGGSPTVPHSNFLSWLTAQGAYAGGGVVTPNPVSGEALVPSATNSFEWLRGSASSPGSGGATNNWGSVPAGNFSLMYSFDTNASGIVPTLMGDGGAGSGCGRTIISDMHVDSSRSSSGVSSGTFPTECLLTAPLSPNEQAFEYLFFVLSSCAIGGAPILTSAPPPPTPPPPLGAVTFTREYHAVCPSSTKVVWQSFSWQAAIPTGTSIVFQAQTTADVSGSPGTYGVAVPVGTASTSTGPVSFTPPTTVDQDLTSAAPPQISLDWLRIKMTFNPTGSTSPVLQSWNQDYDCVPNE